MRILVVEDEAALAVEICDILASAGHVIAGRSNSVQRAQSLLREQKIDLAIVDTVLRDGLVDALVEELKAFHIPFIVISGYAQFQLSAKLGGAPFLPKPFETDALLQMVSLFKRDGEDEPTQ